MQFLILVILIISCTFAFIGITTDYWYQSLMNEFNEGLWIICRAQSSNNFLSSEVCQKQLFFKSQIFAIFGLIFLLITLILSIIHRYKKIDRLAVYVTILILIISTILFMLSYFLYPRKFDFKELGYSIYFMVSATFCNLITIGLIAFNSRNIQSI
ncbi:hypothetical protein I4U23_027049 [Adineta vaga]|nr:hypothetical protein I4U23_027049 [Adineta vaga]